MLVAPDQYDPRPVVFALPTLELIDRIKRMLNAMYDNWFARVIADGDEALQLE